MTRTSCGAEVKLNATTKLRQMTYIQIVKCRQSDHHVRLCTFLLDVPNERWETNEDVKKQDRS